MPEQVGQLACIGAKISPGDIVFASFPSEHFKLAREYDPVFKGTVSVWNVDFDVLRSYISLFQSGAWPAADSSQRDAEEEGETAFCP